MIAATDVPTQPCRLPADPHPWVCGDRCCHVTEFSPFQEGNCVTASDRLLRPLLGVLHRGTACGTAFALALGIRRAPGRLGTALGHPERNHVTERMLHNRLARVDTFG